MRKLPVSKLRDFLIGEQKERKRRWKEVKIWALGSRDYYLESGGGRFEVFVGQLFVWLFFRGKGCKI